MSENLNKLKEIFATVLGIPGESITDALAPDNAETWDSLNAIVLITEIEQGFGVTFSFSEAMSVKNFGEAVTLVRSKGVAI